MSSYDDTNRVTIWINENEEGSRKPKFEVNFNFRGEDFRLALFPSVTRTGKKLLSGTIEQGKGGAPQTVSSGQKLVVPMGDDGVPF